MLNDWGRRPVGCALEWQTGQEATRIDQSPAELGSVGESVTSMVSHPTNDLLWIGTSEGNIVVWDPSNAHSVRRVRAHGGDVTRIVFDPRHDRFLTVSVDGFVQWWNAKFQREQGFSAGCALFAAAASPSGRYVAAGGVDKTLRVWDTTTGELAHTLKGHTQPITALDWTSDSILVSGDGKGYLRCWEVDMRRCFRSGKAHDQHVSHVLVSQSRDWYLTASWDAKVRFWTLKHKLRFELPVGPAPVTCLALLPDEKRLAVGYWDGTIAVWDLENASVFEEFRAHEGSLVGCAAILGDRMIATADQEGILRSWSLATMGVSRFHNMHSGEVYGCAYSPDNTQAISVSHDSQIKVWDRHDTCESASLEGQAGPILACAVSQDKRLWALGTNSGEVRLWNASQQSFEATLGGHADAVSSLVFLPNGEQLLTGSWDMKLILWSLERSQAQCTFHGHSKEIAAIDVSLDGRMAASASWDATARLWDLTASRRDYLGDMRCLAGHSGRVLGCAFSPDGSVLATASADETVLLWPVDKAVDPKVLHGHQDTVTACRFTPDGKLLLSVGRDGKLNVWDAAHATIVAQAEHDSPILTLAISPDGSQAMIGDETGRVRFLQLRYRTGPNWVAATTLYREPPLWKRGAPAVAVHEITCLYCGHGEEIKSTHLGHRWQCASCGEHLMICPKGMPAAPLATVE